MCECAVCVSVCDSATVILPFLLELFYTLSSVNVCDRFSLLSLLQPLSEARPSSIIELFGHCVITPSMHSYRQPRQSEENINIF